MVQDLAAHASIVAVLARMSQDELQATEKSALILRASGYGGYI